MSVRAASGRFLLRIPADLHAALRRAAAARGVSLNEFCATRLAASLGGPLGCEGAERTVRRAAELFGEALVAIAVFGSWSRGEQAERSDVDVLIVLDEAVRIARDLYRRWDEARIEWDGHPVEPHFVHLPDAQRTPSGLWAEVAIDGIVLFDPALRLSRHLIAVRRALAAGRLRRRVVHGQAYWAEVA